MTVMKKLGVILWLCCSISIGKAQSDPVIDRAKVYEPLMLEAAERYRVDPRLLWTIGFLETGFRPGLTSRAGARGLMQLMPATAERYGVRNLFNPAESIDAAAHYLSDLQEIFGHRLDQVLAAYNAGEGAVDAFRTGQRLTLSNGKVINPRGIKSSIPPYRETVAYVKNGLAVFAKLEAAKYFPDSVLADLHRLDTSQRTIALDLEGEPDEIEQLKTGSLYVIRPPQPSVSIYPR